MKIKFKHISNLQINYKMLTPSFYISSTTSCGRAYENWDVLHNPALHFYKSFCFNPLPWNPSWSYAILPYYLAADHFLRINFQLAWKMQLTWFFLTLQSQNGAKTAAVYNGKANQLIRIMRIIQSRSTVYIHMMHLLI